MLKDELKKAIKGLVYISESDAPFKLINPKRILPEVLDFNDLFASLSSEKDWYTGDRKEQARRYGKLWQFLNDNLTDIKVLKIGKVEKEIFIYGTDENGNVVGIQTKSVET